MSQKQLAPANLFFIETASTGHLYFDRQFQWQSFASEMANINRFALNQKLQITHKSFFLHDSKESFIFLKPMLKNDI